MDINTFRNAYGVFRGIRDTVDEAEAIVAIYFALQRIEQDKQNAADAAFEKGLAFGSGAEAARQATADAFMPGILHDMSLPDIVYGVAEPDYSDVRDVPLFQVLDGFLREEFGYDKDAAQEAAADFMRDHWLVGARVGASTGVTQGSVGATEPLSNSLDFSDDTCNCAVCAPVPMPAPTPDFVVTPGGTVFPIEVIYGDDDHALVKTVAAFDKR